MALIVPWQSKWSSHVSRLVKLERSNMTLSPQIRVGDLQSLGTWCFFQRRCDWITYGGIANLCKYAPYSGYPTCDNNQKEKQPTLIWTNITELLCYNKKLILTSKILSIHVNFILPKLKSILSKKTSIHSTCTVFSAGHGLVIWNDNHQSHRMNTFISFDSILGAIFVSARIVKDVHISMNKPCF